MDAFRQPRRLKPRLERRKFRLRGLAAGQYETGE
jgi:hypothetical protein